MRRSTLVTLKSAWKGACTWKGRPLLVRHRLGHCSGTRVFASTSMDDSTLWVLPRCEVNGAESGLLSDLKFAVKDLFDVAGQPTGFGNPQWRDTHPVPSTTCDAVQRCLDAGAKLVGKVQMDELAYSLNGENVHYGTPRNVLAPGRVPGGSSSGSAVAVQAGHVDFSLGSDTAGSVRVPASYCGLYGMKCTWNRIPLSGARPLAQSFDTVGWFARDPDTLRRVGRALLDPAPSPVCPTEWVMARDLWELADSETASSLLGFVQKTVMADDSPVGGFIEGVTLSSSQSDVGTPEEWLNAFRVLQGAEVWGNHGMWVRQEQPSFGPGIRERFDMASKITESDIQKAAALREKLVHHFEAVVGNRLMLIPTAPAPAPQLNTPAADLEGFRKRALSLTCLAGLCELPQITIPCATVDVGNEKCLPVGLSIVGPRNSDEALMDAAVAFASLS